MKKVSLYQIAEDRVEDVIQSILANVEVFEQYKFQPCTKDQKSTIGMVPTTLDGQFVSSDKGNTYLEVMTQTKSPNQWDIKLRTAQRTMAYASREDIQVEDVPSKIVKSFKEDCSAEVLSETTPNEPKVFYVIIRPTGQVIVSAAGNAAEEILGMIRKVLGSLPVVPYETDVYPSELLRAWVNNDKKAVGDDFLLGSKAVVVTTHGVKHTVKGDLYEAPELPPLLADAGSTVEAVEVELEGKVLFTLKDDLTFDGLKFSKEVTEEAENKAGTFLLTLDALTEAIDKTLLRLVAKED
ncbi:putative exonuclease [Vibrio phage 1.121.O._10N.286.46.C4]|nr:putative exonuclease [Vibrio phage 1.121.O._10N.286.46.C4]